MTRRGLRCGEARMVRGQGRARHGRKQAISAKRGAWAGLAREIQRRKTGAICNAMVYQRHGIFSKQWGVAQYHAPGARRRDLRVALRCSRRIDRCRLDEVCKSFDIAHHLSVPVYPGPARSSTLGPRSMVVGVVLVERLEFGASGVQGDVHLRRDICSWFGQKV